MTSPVLPTDADPPASRVRRITLVPFLPDGRCVLIDGPAGLITLWRSSGRREDLIDTVCGAARTAASGISAFAQSVWTRSFMWIQGAVCGTRRHRRAMLAASTAEQAAACLRAGGQPHLAAVVIAAAQSYRTLYARPTTPIACAPLSARTCAADPAGRFRLRRRR